MPQTIRLSAALLAGAAALAVAASPAGAYDRQDGQSQQDFCDTMYSYFTGDAATAASYLAQGNKEMAYTFIDLGNNAYYSAQNAGCGWAQTRPPLQYPTKPIAPTPAPPKLP